MYILKRTFISRAVIYVSNMIHDKRSFFNCAKILYLMMLKSLTIKYTCKWEDSDTPLYSTVPISGIGWDYLQIQNNVVKTENDVKFSFTNVQVQQDFLSRFCYFNISIIFLWRTWPRHRNVSKINKWIVLHELWSDFQVMRLFHYIMLSHPKE